MQDIKTKHTHHAVKEILFKYGLTANGISISLLLIAIFLTLSLHSRDSIGHFGFSFLWNNIWDPVKVKFGVVPFVVGTLAISFLAVGISAPLSLSLAIFLGEYHQRGPVSSFVRTTVELLAGIPSVIYGFWAIFFLVPVARTIETQLGLIPDGVGLFTAAIILAIMVIPYSASISREVITMVPRDLKEAGYALGSTRYEVIKNIVLPYTRSGILAGTVLALGRAIGETMAVTMVIGNRNSLSPEPIINQGGILGIMETWNHGIGAFISHAVPVIASLFGSSNTMASLIANEFAEATNATYLSSIIEIGLLLFIVSTILNVLGKEVIRRLNRI